MIFNIENSFNKIAWPNCLPSDVLNNFEGNIGKIVGWGYTDNIDASIIMPGSDTPFVLQQANVKIHSNRDDICVNKKLGVPAPKIILCAGYGGRGGNDSCVKDEGHGMFIKEDSDSEV